MTRDAAPPLTLEWRDERAHRHRRRRVLQLRLHTNNEMCVAVQTCGTQLWPCSVLMADFLAHTDAAAGRRLLELGCGVGLLALLAGRLGAAAYTGVDVSADALALCRRNLAMSTAADTEEAAECSVRLVQTDVCAPGVSAALLCPAPDVIVACDMVYDAPLTAALVEVLATALARRRDTVALLAFERRVNFVMPRMEVADVAAECLQRELQRAGLVADVIDVSKLPTRFVGVARPPHAVLMRVRTASC